jgi:hypothetical protein
MSEAPKDAPELDAIFAPLPSAEKWSPLALKLPA